MKYTLCYILLVKKRENEGSKKMERQKLTERVRYHFIKRPIKCVKGWEVIYHGIGESWGGSLGFFKTIKEARDCVAKHKEGLR